jgi:hypothetical protein
MGGLEKTQMVPQSGNNLSLGCVGVIGMIEVVGCGFCLASWLYVYLHGKASEGL